MHTRLNPGMSWKEDLAYWVEDNESLIQLLPLNFDPILNEMSVSRGTEFPTEEISRKLVIPCLFRLIGCHPLRHAVEPSISKVIETILCKCFAKREDNIVLIVIIAGPVKVNGTICGIA